MKALTFSEFGGPEVLEYRDVPDPDYSAGEVLVEMKSIGLNYADVYRRRGDYHLAGEPPWIAGFEGAGIVRESPSEEFETGDRVAFADVPFANAELVVAPAEHLVRLPATIPFDLAATVMLQGMTAQYLARDSYRVKEGDWVLVHAAAGGVGQILTQICRLHGARVVGLSRNPDKLALIRGCGAEQALLLDADWVENVRQATDGAVDVTFDSVGATLADSFAVTRDGGTVVFYGMSGGNPEPVDPRMLMDTSKALVGGDLWGYLTSAEERRSRALELFGWLVGGELVIAPQVAYPLADGAEAHAFLESGLSAGKVLLIP